MSTSTPEQIQNTENRELALLRDGRGKFDADVKRISDPKPSLEEMVGFMSYLGQLQNWLVTFQPMVVYLQGLGHGAVASAVHEFAALLDKSKADHTPLLQQLQQDRAAFLAARDKAQQEVAQSQRDLVAWEHQSSMQAVQNVEDQMQRLREGQFSPLDYIRPNSIPIWVH